MTRHWIGCALACVLTLSALAAGGLAAFERPLIDLRMRLLERPADSGPVLIEIGPRSIHEIGTWPWPRSLHALLLDRLTAAGVGHIYLDIDFSLRTVEYEDAPLEGALARRGGATTLAAFRQWSESEQAYVDAAPLPRFSQHARLASTNMVPASDGLIREARESYPWRGAELPSFAAAIAGRTTPQPGSFYIDYGIDLTGITRLSFVDVASGDFDPETLRGRPVVVGATAVDLGDILSVPNHRVLPGVVVQLLAAQSIMLDRALTRLPFWVFLLAVPAFVVALNGLALRREVMPAAALLVGGNVLLWGGAVAVQAAFPIILDVVPFTLASFGAAAITFLVRFQSVATKLVIETLARRRSEQFMGVVAQNAFDAIVTTNGAGQVSFINAAASRMFGVSPAEVQGVPASHFIARSEGVDFQGGELHAALQRIRASGRPRRLVCRRSSGEVFHADLTVSELPGEERQVFILQVRDIDRRVMAERRLVARERELRRAKAEAEIANQSKTAFLANMSHELKTPLNAIIGFSEIMEQQLLGPLGSGSYVNYAKDIRESGERLLHAVSDVLEFSRLEANEANLDERDFDLVGLCRQMADHCALRCRQGSRVFEGYVPPAEARYSGDERLIRLALNHLLSNALKFTPQGGQIAFTLNLNDDGSAEIVIRDTGVGIPEAEIDSCFEAFVQADPSLSRAHEGAGLGLTLAKRLIELHQGSIALRSAVGQGTTVIITLPAARRCPGNLLRSA